MIVFIPLTPVSEIFGTLFWGLISRRNTTREDPFTGEDPLTGWGEDEHQGPAGPITFLRSRKLCVLHASRMIDVRTLTLQFKVSLCTLFSTP